MIRIIWIDSETTGLDEKKHSLIQLACVVDEIVGDNFTPKEIGRLNLFIKPFRGDYINKDALEKTGTSISDFKTKKYLPPMVAHTELIEFLEQFVNRYERTDKFIIAGKNVKFDIKFLRAFFNKCEDNYYGSWFHYPSIDIETSFAEYMVCSGNILKDYKLETMCEFFDITIDNAHDAMCDILATREIYNEHLS